MMIPSGEDAFVPFGSVENDHLEIRTRLSAAVTTTQLLLERLKRYQRIILESVLSV